MLLSTCHLKYINHYNIVLCLALISSRSRLLASVLHPHHDAFIAAESGHLALPPLGTIPCATMAKLHGSQGHGTKSHLTYPCPFTGFNLPITMKITSTHVLDAKAVRTSGKLLIDTIANDLGWP